MEKVDENGYPTSEALLEVARYDVIKQGIHGYLKLIKSLWYYPDRFILKKDELYLSTGGWSGNESVIESMRQNFFFFIAHTKWQRGGHYWFDLKCFKKAKKES